MLSEWFFNIQQLLTANYIFIYDLNIAAPYPVFKEAFCQVQFYKLGNEDFYD